MRMDWTIMWTIIGVNIALSALIGTFILWAFNKLDSDIQSFKSEVHQRFSYLKDDIKDIRDDIKDIRKEVSRIDKEVAIITATLRFNGFDLDRHRAEGE